MLKTNNFEYTMFIYTLIFLIVIPVILIAENIIIGYPFSANYKWFICVVVALACLYLSIKTKRIQLIQVILYTFIIFILLPFGWFLAGRYNSFTIAYSLLIYISIIYLFTGYLKLFFLTAELVIVIILLYFNLNEPTYFLEVSEGVSYVDSIIQAFLTFSLTGIIINTFTNSYRKEQQSLKELTVLLDEQNKALNYLAITDDLTKVYNRRHIFNYFKQLETGLQQKIRYIVGMIDVDSFKMINDTYGHAIGDQVLIQVSSNLKDIVLDKGLIGRYGGDEFLVILEDIDSYNYQDVIDQIAKIHIALPNVNIPITLSGGFVFMNNELSPDKVLLHADAMLYKVKNSGKNSIYLNSSLE